ncbi:MAG: hypothetical protein H6704_06360 [Myxococcales bacterium]|nr:hypothetical protein [Myxococcales bacterium]
MRRAALALLAMLASACGRPPPATLAEQRAAVEARPDADPARRGWWRYLAGDVEGARADFARAPDAPLAALGRARLAARTRWTPRRRWRPPPSRPAATAWWAAWAGFWAEAAASEVPDGEAALRRALGAAAADRVPLEGATHTLRISFLPFLDLRRLIAHPPTAKGDSVRALGRRWALEARTPRADPDGLILTRWPLEPGAAHLELQVDGPARAWRDGRLVMATADDRHGPRTQRFTAEGTGPLIVVWAARRGPKAWRWRRPAAPAPVDPGPAVPDRRPTPDAVDRYLALEAALGTATPRRPSRSWTAPPARRPSRRWRPRRRWTRLTPRRGRPGRGPRALDRGGAGDAGPRGPGAGAAGAARGRSGRGRRAADRGGAPGAGRLRGPPARACARWRRAARAPRPAPRCAPPSAPRRIPASCSICACR